MKTIALGQFYNEGMFLDKGFQWLYPLVDKIVISEGKLTPFGKLSQSSEDGTRKIIERWLKGDADSGANKIVFMDAHEGNANNREQAEGNNKNNLLNKAKSFLNNGDLLYIFDADEFWHPENFLNVVHKFKHNDKINHMPVGWFNFVYDLKRGCKGKIDGRFMRYTDGARFASTNHFIYPNGKDITKDHSNFLPYEKSRLVHLSYAKHPNLIKQKVISFNRSSFKAWWNHCFLVGVTNLEKAYENNRKLSARMGWPGGGFLEGQKIKIQPFQDNLPEAIGDLKLDWKKYIIKNIQRLRLS